MNNIRTQKSKNRYPPEYLYKISEISIEIARSTLLRSFPSSQSRTIPKFPQPLQSLHQRHLRPTRRNATRPENKETKEENERRIACIRARGPLIDVFRSISWQEGRGWRPSAVLLSFGFIELTDSV